MESNSNEPIENNNEPSQPQYETAPPPPPPPGTSKKSNKSLAIKITLGLLAIVLILTGYIGFRMY
ncbi:MAG: twin transmembrane helix small protein, partial [Elusimicrobiota bacterium]|nr:twin transmembrane helix small protein [Elusimicrobiota bacterium]